MGRAAFAGPDTGVGFELSRVNLKNVDLVNEFGADQGFWQSFSEGVDNIRVEEGQMKIKLKE